MHKTKPSFATIVQSFALLVALFSPLASQADGLVASDFVFQLDNAVLRTPTFDLQKMLSGTADVNLPDFVLQDQAPVQVSGIHLSLAYKFNTASQYPLMGTEIPVSATNFSGTLNIAKIDVDAQIVRRENGAVAIGRLKASCTDIVVDLIPGKAQVSGSLAVVVGDDGLPTAQVPWFQVNWSEDAWVVRSLSCTGARGFDAKVKASIHDYLKRSDAFQSQFKSFIDDQIQLYQLQIQNFFMQPIELPLGLMGVTAVLNPQKIETVEGDRFQVRGRLEVKFASSNISETVEVSEAAKLATQPGYTLAVPPSALQALNQMAYRVGLYSQHKYGSAMTSFQEFRNSSFVVSLVWPELGWYPMEMDFAFDIKASAMPTLSALAADATGQMNTDFASPIAIDVWSQKFNVPKVEYIPFDHFAAQASTHISAAITPATAGSTLTFVFANTKLPLTHSWDPSYPVRDPNVATDTIGGKLEETLDTTPYVLSFGKFPLSSTLSLTPAAFRQNSSWLLLDMRSL